MLLLRPPSPQLFLLMTISWSLPPPSLPIQPRCIPTANRGSEALHNNEKFPETKMPRRALLHIAMLASKDATAASFNARQELSSLASEAPVGCSSHACSFLPKLHLRETCWKQSTEAAPDGPSPTPSRSPDAHSVRDHRALYIYSKMHVVNALEISLSAVHSVTVPVYLYHHEGNDTTKNPLIPDVLVATFVKRRTFEAASFFSRGC